MNKDRRARQKVGSKSRHEHVPGERCTRCRPLPMTPDERVTQVQQGVTTTWRTPTAPLNALLGGIRGLQAQLDRAGVQRKHGPQGLRVRRHQAR
jgi:hypothetical protein